MANNECVSIALTQDKVAIIDASDFNKVKDIKWHYEHGYARSGSKHGKVYMHRFLHGEVPGKVTDHINGNRLDNRRDNLRYATRAENAYNSSGVKNGTSRFKGVSRMKSTGRWRARIMVNYKEISLGVFDTELAARMRYVQAAQYYQGEFARID